MIRRVFLTGASGFIGKHVLRSLLDSGVSVKVLTRDAARIPRADRLTLVGGELSDRALLTRAVVDCDAIIHCASYVGPDRARQRQVNEHGTTNLIATAEACGALPFMYMSTAGVYGGQIGCGRRENELVPNPGSDLAASRYRAERLVAKYGGAIIRPNLIYGEGDRTVFLPLLKAMLRLGAWIGDCKATVSAISVTTLGELAAALVHVGSEGTAIYHAAHPQPVSMDEMLSPVFRRLELAPPTTAISIDEAFRALRAGGVSRRQLAMVGQHNWYDSSKIWSATHLCPSPQNRMSVGEVEYYAAEIRPQLG
jgi:nucleoside-diphosphate-sugar epimerase